jgi:HrpA-like RNA helicase
MNNIGILDPNGVNINPINSKPYSQSYIDIRERTKWDKLPAYDNRISIINDCSSNQVILIISGTGSGKTVLIPKFVLHAIGYDSHIIITLPKQIIAKSAAEFATLTLDVELGKEVGYQYKGSDKKNRGNNPVLLYATDGTLVSFLQSDPLLLSYDAVIIDEAHERKIQIDLLLYLLKNVLSKRPEFKLIIMSATIDETIFESYYNEFKFKTINIGGKTNYPIESIFDSNMSDPNSYEQKGIEIIAKIIAENSKIDAQTKVNDILFFVTSHNETILIAKKLALQYPQKKIIPVYSGISDSVQDELQNKQDLSQRIIISTNVAESSLTVDGIKYVIDSGYELKSYDDPKYRGKVLEKQLITLAQAMQRMGRSGRTQSGICYHLYSKSEFDSMIKFPLPAIRTTDITTECIRLLVDSPSKTIKELLSMLSSFIEAPREAYIRRAVDNLKQMSLLKDCELEKCTLNELGELVGKLQLDPYQSITLIIAYELRCFRECLLCITCIEVTKGSIGDLFHSTPDPVSSRDLYLKYITKRNKFNNSNGDHLTMMNIIENYLKMKEKYKGDYDKLKDWAYTNFLKIGSLEKINEGYRRLNYKLRDIISSKKEYLKELFQGLQNLDIEEYKLEQKILASFLYGYKLNLADRINNSKGNMFKTPEDLEVSVSKDSVLAKTSHRNVFYDQLFTMKNGSRINSDLKIVSLIPLKSKEIVEQILF